MPSYTNQKQNKEVNIWAAVIALLAIAAVLGLLVLANIEIWSAIF